MTDVDHLLRAIRENPQEDAPRLMLADELADTGFSLAADYMRESIAFDRSAPGARPPKPRQRRRKKIAQGYIRWLESRFGLPVAGTDPFSGICGGETWDRFHWRAVGESRSCLFKVVRGLPASLTVTAPLLMQRTADLFSFPIASVTVSADRKPERDAMGEVLYIWVCATWPQVWNTWEETAHQIPRPLFDLLPQDPNIRWKGHYTSMREACDALNTAALAFGRASVAPVLSLT